MSPLLPADDDATLVALALAGDRGATSALLHRHAGAVHHFLLRLAGDAAVADDVLQETLLAAHQHLADFRGTGAFRGWLFAIARSRLWQHTRLRRGEPREYAPVESLETLGLAAGFGAPLDPEELALRVEQRARLEAALAALPAEEREVVVLRDLEGLSGEEAAVALALSLPAMKSRLHRGRLRLVAELKKGAAS